jgi:hypothetical protein
MFVELKRLVSVKFILKNNSKKILIENINKVDLE